MSQLPNNIAKKAILLVAFSTSAVALSLGLIDVLSIRPSFSVKSPSMLEFAMAKKVDDLTEKYDAINQVLSKAPTDLPTRSLIVRLSNVEAKEQAIGETILVDPDKALTARLLREQQQALDTRVTEIQESQRELNSKIDNIMTAVVAIPLGGFVLSILTALVIYLIGKFQVLKRA